jgi:phosphatidylinositol alpha-1,6-mannosyltransferase
MIILSVQTFPPDAGGKQVLMESLARAASTQTEVLVLADKIREGRQELPHKTTSYKIDRYGGMKALRQRRKAQDIARLVREHDVTHVFCDSWRSAEHLPKDLPCSVTTYAHGNEYALSGENVDKSKSRRLAKTFAKIDHIIAVSKPTAKRVESSFSSDIDKNSLPMLHVINNPVAAAAPVTEREIDQAEFLWPIEGKATTRLLALSRLIPLKGIDYAIKALKQLTDEGKSLQMVIAGEGEDKTRLETLVNDYGLQNRMRFIGHVTGPEKTALFDSADIFIQPGRKIGEHEEGFGITYLEAGLQGIPSLCGQAGGAPEAVLHEKTGLVVNASEVKYVVDGLRRLIDEPQQTSHMGKAAQAHAQALLWDKQIIPILDRVKEIRGTRRG